MRKLGIETVRDLLFYFPRSYEDRSKTVTLSEAEIGEMLNVRGRIVKAPITVNLPGGRSMQKCVICDENGDELRIIWFNQNYLARTIKNSNEYIFYGKLEKLGNSFQMTSPKFTPSLNEAKATGILPLYPLTDKVTHKMLQEAVREVMPAIYEVKETLPQEILKEYDLADIHFALKNIHFPIDFEAFERAKRRLVFEEFFMLLLGLSYFKKANEERKAMALREGQVPPLRNFVNSLPFELTDSQKKVMREIADDLAKDKPMARLLQGDVGSGKTVIAAIGLLICVLNGKNGVMMAPTEILAEQHYESFEKMFDGICEVVLLKGGMTAKERREALESITFGKPKIIIGTHALLQKGVDIPNLGLVITDEQHRFGVRQREILVDKGKSEEIVPHLLVMSATPIPRTLALILYGDLDISVIDQMPIGRKAIKTYAVDESFRERINNFVRKEVASGRQVYIVCPLIEESEKIDAKAVTNFKDVAFKDLRVEIIHGKMKANEKTDIMQRFARGDVDVLISTTVIEVGVNVPNASVMVIENSERYGLSQLHQLRGRVGRGEYQSYCILFVNGDSEAAKERAKIMSSTNNGFEIAERDLKMRGFGDFFGTRQAGVPELKLANLYEDMNILADAKKAAEGFNLAAHKELLCKIERMFIEGL